MKERILSLLSQRSEESASISELLQGLKLPQCRKRELLRSLQELEREKRVARIRGNQHVLVRNGDTHAITGRIQITRSGRGFLKPDDCSIAEIAVPAGLTGTAFHNDRVVVELEGKSSRRSGRVIEVLERRSRQIVGTFRKGRSRFHVVPDDPRLPPQIVVRRAHNICQRVRSGDKVVVRLSRWDAASERPRGEVVEVLGPPTAEGVDMLGVIRQYELPQNFPPGVLREVRSFGTEVSDREMVGRNDCRSHPVITIDPEDAKDFDDAFSLEWTSRGRWKLRVHIADVSHYVKPGTALDAEARRRGNSTYLVDRVIPMLPEELSNELCSLKPRVDRLTKCVEFLITDDGKVVESCCYPAVIHSRRRFTYEEAMKVLDGSPSNGLEKMLHDARLLAGKVRRRRFRNGSLDLDFPENKIRLDERGRVERIEHCENDASHQLIEEFMLLANEAVAKELKRLKRPAVHRVHQHPDPKRLREYRAEVLKRNVECGNLEKPAEVRKLLRRLGELPIGPALKIGFLKSLTRAGYSVDPAGHYGLAKADYAHFTSPIRRYADLLVHRSLFSKKGWAAKSLGEIAEHISATERNSADAERDSRSVKLQAFLEEQIREGKRHRYAAIVTEIREFGLFVDVTDLGMGGLIPFSTLEEDHFTVEGEGSLARGRRNGRIIRLGDRVEVEVARVDTSKKQVDFRFPVRGRQRPSSKRGRGRRGHSRRRKPAAAG